MQAPKLEMFLRYAKKLVSYHGELESIPDKILFYGSYRKLAKEMRELANQVKAVKGIAMTPY